MPFTLPRVVATCIEHDDLRGRLRLCHHIDNLVERQRTVLRVGLAVHVRVQREEIIAALDLHAMTRKKELNRPTFAGGSNS